MSWRRGEGSAVRTLPEGDPQPEEDVGSPLPQPPPRAGISAWRRVAVAVAVVLAAGSSWQLTRDGTRGGPPPRPTSPTTGATAMPTSATPDPSKPPELRNTGEDFDTIVRSVHGFRNWVQQFDPDPKWVPLYTDPLNDGDYGFEREKKYLDDLKSAGHHYDAPATTIRKVIVRHRVTDDQVAVYTVYEGSPANIVDIQGTVVTAQPTLPPTGFLEDWVRGDDGRWRLFHTEVLGPPAPEILR